MLFDGLCGMCDATVQWVLAKDQRGAFRMAPLQGETAAAVFARHPEIPEGLDSIVIVERVNGEEILSWESAAISAMGRYLPFPWRVLSWVGFVPRWLANPFYRLVARNRYRIMGRMESCRIPSEAEAARFFP